MKKSIYLIATLCVAVFSSCSSDGDSSPEFGQGQTAQIQLTLTGANTRASGTTDPATGVAADEATVGNIVVGIFDGDGNKLVIQEVLTPNIGSANTITVPSVKGTMSGCTGVVVANVPAASVTTLKNTTTKSLFLGETISLEAATAPNSATTQSSASLPMSGDVKDTGNSDATTFSLTSGGTKSGLAVSLVRMVSRVTLNSLSADFTGTAYPDATFKLQRVFLRDAIAATKVTTSVTPADAMSGTSYLTGGGTWDGSAWAGGNNYLYDALATGSEVAIISTTTLPNSKYYWFYAFANSGSASPTAFVIQGLFDPDGTGSAVTTVFYPVIIGKIQTGTTYETGSGSTTGSIVRNSLYNLSVTIKSKGTTSPTDDINPVNLSITVGVAAWNATIIGQEVTF